MSKNDLFTFNGSSAKNLGGLANNQGGFGAGTYVYKYADPRDSPHAAFVNSIRSRLNQQYQSIEWSRKAAENPEFLLDNYSSGISKLWEGSESSKYLLGDGGEPGLLKDIYANFPMLTQEQMNALYTTVAADFYSKIMRLFSAAHPAAEKILNDLNSETGLNRQLGNFGGIGKSSKKKRSSKRSQ